MSNPYFRGPPMAPQYNRRPLTGNVIRVDSLEQALAIPTSYHSENVYFDNVQNFMYRIYTNEIGDKTYSIFDLTLHQPVPETPSLNDGTLDDIIKRLSVVEQALGVRNEKSNVSTNAGSTTPAGQSTAQQ